jgi:hypothetical protein
LIASTYFLATDRIYTRPLVLKSKNRGFAPRKALKSALLDSPKNEAFQGKMTRMVILVETRQGRRVETAAEMLNDEGSRPR